MEESIFKTFTKPQWIAFLLCGSMYFISDSVYGLQGPLYPKEAEKRNVSGKVAGLVLGCYEVVQIVAVPTVSTLAPVIGPRTTFNLSVLIAGFSIIGFGFLNFAVNAGLFVGLSFLLRILQAIGEGGIYTTVFIWIGTEFPDAVGQVFGGMETAFGGGTSLGPFIGAMLYALGNLFDFGFTLPFLVVGILHFILAWFVNRSLYSKDRERKVSTLGSNKVDPAIDRLGFLSILKSRRLLVYALAPCIYGLNTGVLTALLGPYLTKHLGETELVIGLMFLLQAVAYSLAASLVGYCTDRLRRPLILLLVVTGAIGSGIGFWILDPVYFLPVPRSMLWVSVSLSVIGISQSFINIPAFVLMLRQSRKLDLPQDVAASYSSSLWFSSFSLGSFIGPFLAGALSDVMTSSNTFLVIGSINFALGICFMMVMIKYGIAAIPSRIASGRKHEGNSSNEQTPLINPFK